VLECHYKRLNKVPDCRHRKEGGVNMTRSAKGILGRSPVSICVLLSLSSGLHAAGFYVPQKGAVGVGVAMAGDSARASDAGTVYFNPAGMTELGGAMAQGGIDFLSPDVRIRNQGSAAVTPGTLGAAVPYSGGDGSAGRLTPIPNFYYARPLRGGDLWLGLAVAAPFGLGIDYGRDWFGRYDSIKSQLATVDLAPSLAYRASPSWSIGGGIDFQYADAQLTNAIPNTLNPGGPTPATDGIAKLTGNGWSTGFNVGVLYHDSPNTRIGLHYRSAIGHKLDGQVTIEGFAGPLSAANGTFNTRTDFKLPQIVSLGLAHRASPAWTLLAEYQWFGWSAFDEVRVRFDSGVPDSVRPEKFRNTHSAAFGAEYKWSDRTTLRGGVRFEQSPTIDAFRNTSIPDSDLLWLGLGATFKLSDGLLLDLGYVRANFRRASINRTSTAFAGTPLSGTTTVSGRTDNTVDTLAMSLRYRF